MLSDSGLIKNERKTTYYRSQVQLKTLKVVKELILDIHVLFIDRTWYYTSFHFKQDSSKA